MPKISVVIPVYNKEKYLKNTIKSVLQQSFSDFELILIDDGSTDYSANIIKQFSDSRIVFYTQENQGVSATRNKGISLANSELIAFLDADDYWYPNHLQEIYDLYLNFPDAKFFATAYEIIYQNGGVKKHVYPFPEKQIQIEKYYRFSKGIHLFYTSNFAVKKEAFVNVGGFKEMHSEDIDLFLSIGIKYPMAYSQLITMKYRFDVAKSLSKKHTAEERIRLAENFKALEKTDIDLKQFLDFYRYTWIIDLRLANKLVVAKELVKQIDLKNLTKTQRFLVKRSRKQLLFLKKIQALLVKAKVSYKVSTH